MDDEGWVYFLGFRTLLPAIVCSYKKGIWFDEYSRWEFNAGPVLYTFLAGLSAEQGYLILYHKREAYMISAYTMIV